jgi:hypothetical protein
MNKNDPFSSSVVCGILFVFQVLLVFCKADTSAPARSVGSRGWDARGALALGRPPLSSSVTSHRVSLRF